MLVPIFIWHQKNLNLDGIFLMERGFNGLSGLVRIKNPYHPVRMTSLVAL